MYNQQIAHVAAAILKFSIVLQSAEVYDYVRNDISELTATVQEEVSSTATALKQKLKVIPIKIATCCDVTPRFLQIEESSGTAATVKKSLTSFLNQVSDAFYIPPEDDDEPIFLNKLQGLNQLLLLMIPNAIQISPNQLKSTLWGATQ